MNDAIESRNHLESWKAAFTKTAVAAEAKRRSFWRRRGFLIPAVAIALGGAAAGTTAAVLNDSPGPPTLRESITLGYTDLRTGEPITCPDGSPLRFTTEAVPGAAKTRPTPVCSDGTVPEVYKDQRQAYEEWAAKQEFGTPLSDGPVFSFVIDE